MEIAQESGYTVDKAGFDEEMNKQRERARNAREDAESMSSQSADLMNFTEESTFVGYDERMCKAHVIGLFKDGHKVEELNDEGDVILIRLFSMQKVEDRLRLWTYRRRSNC